MPEKNTDNDLEIELAYYKMLESCIKNERSISQKSTDTTTAKTVTKK